MRLKEGYVLRTICGQNVLSPEGLVNVDMSKIISLNESAAYLWTSLQGKDFTAEDAARLLTDKYEVSLQRAMGDVEALLQKWEEIGLI